MKKLIAIFLLLALISLCFTACMRSKDRAENNGVVTDDTTAKADTTHKDTTDRTTTDRKTDSKDTSRRDTDTTDRKDDGILDDAGDAVSDAVRGATDAVDDILGGRDTTN